MSCSQTAAEFQACAARGWRRIALAGVRKQGFVADLTRYRRRRCHSCSVDWVLAPLFPRYVFVSWDPSAVRWRSINGTFDVQYLVCCGDGPARVPAGVVEEITAREGADGSVALNRGRFSKRERLRVQARAFADCIGLFDQMAENERVWMLLELLGRQVRIRVPASAVGAELKAGRDKPENFPAERDVNRPVAARRTRLPSAPPVVRKVR